LQFYFTIGDMIINPSCIGVIHEVKTIMKRAMSRGTS
jgi:hypothetical protein